MSIARAIPRRRYRRDQSIASAKQRLARKLRPSNDRSSEYFARDGEIVNRVRPALKEMGYCSIRMAFCLGKPVAKEGNLFPDQQANAEDWGKG